MNHVENKVRRNESYFSINFVGRDMMSGYFQNDTVKRLPDRKREDSSNLDLLKAVKC